jgi:hypothetical protein
VVNSFMISLGYSAQVLSAIFHLWAEKYISIPSNFLKAG